MAQAKATSDTSKREQAARDARRRADTETGAFLFPGRIWQEAMRGCGSGRRNNGAHHLVGKAYDR